MRLYSRCSPSPLSNLYLESVEADNEDRMSIAFGSICLILAFFLNDIKELLSMEVAANVDPRDTEAVKRASHEEPRATV
jgi:hypothetical protein